MSTSPHPTADAVPLFTDLLTRRGLTLAELRPEQALAVWLEFAEVPFEVPDETQADGLLYQYGVFRFSGEPRFHFDLTRQFAVADYDEFLQVHCDLQLAVTAELSALGGDSEWYWWEEDEPPLQEWAAGLRARPEWRVLTGLEPVAVDLYIGGT